MRPEVALGVRGCEECDLRRLQMLTCDREARAEGAALHKKRPLIPRLDHGPQILMRVEGVERSVDYYRDVAR